MLFGASKWAPFELRLQFRPVCVWAASERRPNGARECGDWNGMLRVARSLGSPAAKGRPQLSVSGNNCASLLIDHHQSITSTRFELGPPKCSHSLGHAAGEFEMFQRQSPRGALLADLPLALEGATSAAGSAPVAPRPGPLFATETGCFLMTRRRESHSVSARR